MKIKSVTGNTRIKNPFVKSLPTTVICVIPVIAVKSILHTFQ